MKFVGEPLRILDFDCEARPLSWYGGDFVTKEITAIAWKWVGDKSLVECRVLEIDGLTNADQYPELAGMRDMLWDFTEAYNAADMVTGHFIRGYDLPAINSALIEAGMNPLRQKMTHDTKLDLIRFSGLSKSQENLAAMLGIKAPKIKMTQQDWRDANRLTTDGVSKTIKRVTGDVTQHIKLRQRLMEAGMLGPPKPWRPHTHGQVYRP